MADHINGNIESEEDQPIGDHTLDTTFDGLEGEPLDCSLTTDGHAKTNNSEDYNEESKKQNGLSNTSIDRYGFTGGTQYTDPEEWVY